MKDLQWTGERVIPEKMKVGESSAHTEHLQRILKEHLARYHWAKRFCHRAKVLDASCGSGYGSAILSVQADWVLGVDISREAVNYAFKKYANAKTGYAVCDLSKGFPEAGLSGVVVSFETIEHLKDPTIFLHNVKNNFKNTFIFSIPLNNKGEFHEVEYTLQEATYLIENVFERDSYEVCYYTQEMEKITIGVNENSRFILGVITRK